MKDLNSTNGSFLNGEVVTKAELKQGDVFRIGDCEFRVVVDAPDSAPAGQSPLSEETEAVDPESLSGGFQRLRETWAGFAKAQANPPHCDPSSPSTDDAAGSSALGENRIDFTSLDPATFDQLEDSAESFRQDESPTTNVRGFESETKEEKAGRRGPLRLTVICECPDGKTEPHRRATRTDNQRW